MSSRAAGISRQDGKDLEHKRIAFPAWRRLTRFEALLPPLLFALVLWTVAPWRSAYQLGPDEGLNLMKAALVVEGFSLYSEIWSDQPPLLTFILAAVHHAFPFSVDAARAVILGFSGLLLWCLFSSVRFLEGRMCAWLAVIALVAITDFQAQSLAVLIGLPAVALAMAALQQSIAGASDNENWHYWLAGALFGLALQTKLFVAVLLPCLILATFIRLDGSWATWQMRAPRLARLAIGAAAVFTAIAVLSGEPLWSQLTVPHYQASFVLADRGGFLELLRKLAADIPAFVLVLFGLGLIEALRRVKATRLVPLVWLVCVVLVLGWHRPLWPHHPILLYPSIVWIAALAVYLVQPEDGRRVVTLVCALFLAGTAVWTASTQAPHGFAGGPRSDEGPAAAVLQQAPADSWVFADNVMDAYRAGRLVPPELAVWSYKRVAIGKLNSKELIASVAARQPERLLFRRFEQPRPFLDFLASSYAERRFKVRLSRKSPAPRLFMHGADPASDASPAAQALIAATKALTARSFAGGFAAHYDLRTGKTWGEGRKFEPMDGGTIKVRPPGSTQQVGQCFLRARKVTGAVLFWEAAQAAGKALACAQGPHGGWASVAHLSARCAPRSELDIDPVATLDEGATQLAIAFLMDLAAVYATKPTPPPSWLEPSIRNGLDFLIQVQKKDGGWPQRYPKAKDGYAEYATLNDGVTSEAIAILLRGYRLFGDKGYLEAAKRGGDFLIEVQGAAPQPAWAQQYGPDGRPAAARSFEPAAYGSEETGFAMNALLDLYVATGDQRFLTGLDAARNWLERSSIRPGVWSRLYEIGTNRPIYGDRDGKTHYSLAEISSERQTGYRWESAFPSVIRALGRYQALSAAGFDGLLRYEEEAEGNRRRQQYAKASPLVDEIVSRVVPGEGWVEKEILSTRAFIANCNTLLDSLEFASDGAG